MHSLIQRTDDWTLEVLADDSDQPGSRSTLEKELQGCCFIKELKESRLYIGEIRYEEQKHDQLVFVEAIVLERSQQHPQMQHPSITGITEGDIKYFRRNRFEGDNCKTEAALYAFNLKNEIDLRYFPGKS
ncbi:MAG: hypothetical protein AABY40_03920 [Nanoarchaeota archaeon]